jgi:hypothetical protein
MSPFERWSVWLTSLVTAATGIVLLWMKYFLEPGDQWSVINHPWEPLVLKLHILSAPLLVFALGLITLRHVWEHVRLGVGRGRRSGYTLAVAAIVMVVTGYLIQVVTQEGWLRLVALIHIGVGLAYVAWLSVHRVLVRLAGEGERSET